MKVSPPITPENLDRVHRVGPKRENRPRAILVKFATYRARNLVFRSKKNFKKPEAENEHLLFQARQYKTQKKILDCWS